MPLKPMTYTTTLDAPLEATYQTVYDQQLKYFQHFDPSITELVPGEVIESQMRTKVQQEQVPTQVEVTAITADAAIETKVSYSQGEITVGYRFEAAESGTRVTYSELNSFNKNSLTTNFWFVGWLYTFMYKRNLKKRMAVIEQLALKAAK
ncbi:DUF3284 domain-containing protein [Lacticaseibacillus kribbianus]|uniref:DUF3284 domain-containing protein n=1 Tax=Lacticaseibacillus kribbianus TaxID=2926292 RepID=UPI001CD431E8|nr:DUF3284 domain-containing protein [Lacticaseibacillus kribbianus]